jgi:hypothetical protein
LELEPHPGYWRVTTYRPGEPPHITWFAYEDKRIAEDMLAEAPTFWKDPEMVLDTEFDPSVFGDEDADDQYEAWKHEDWY